MYFANQNEMATLTLSVLASQKFHHLFLASTQHLSVSVFIRTIQKSNSWDVSTQKNQQITSKCIVHKLTFSLSLAINLWPAFCFHVENVEGHSIFYL